MALSCYGRKRDQTSSNQMHREGISASSNIVMEVTVQLCRMLVRRAREENAALDNIDFKSTSNTSAGVFHGPCISIFQCRRRGESQGEIRTFATSHRNVSKQGDRGVPELPDFYAEIPDCTLPQNNPPAPGCSFEIGSRLNSSEKFVLPINGNPDSYLAIDHAHEQNIAKVKENRGAVGLTSDPSALRRWTIGGPEICRLLNEFNHSEDAHHDEVSFSRTHHEQAKSYQSRFADHFATLKVAFLAYENSFSVQETELNAIDSSVVVGTDAVQTMYDAVEKSESYKSFVDERLVKESGSLYDPIRKSILENLLKKLSEVDPPHGCEGLIIDGAVLVHNIKPRPDVKTFKSYVGQLISNIGYTRKQMKIFRVDIAWDLYSSSSLKEASRSSRGTEVRRKDIPNEGPGGNLGQHPAMPKIAGTQPPPSKEQRRYTPPTPSPSSTILGMDA
ncbi:unnamed protein product [Phaedon cochleariae]|uniref:Uncharacterized protein n=1 Tax=Phaedon cochleariae TaxID=80249 RepID=A0A9N9SM45_PHACE|nr:unnamed protein product [Phaedon cochleariae]